MSDTILSIRISGGSSRSYDKDYSEETHVQIQKLRSIVEQLKHKKDNPTFYIKAFRHALRHTSLRLIGADTVYALICDAQIINAYIIWLLQQRRIQGAIELLKLDAPIKELKTGGSFGLSGSLIRGGKVQVDYCDSPSISDLVESIDSNACKLGDMLGENESQLDAVHRDIIKTLNTSN